MNVLTCICIHMCTLPHHISMCVRSWLAVFGQRSMRVLVGQASQHACGETESQVLNGPFFLNIY